MENALARTGCCHYWSILLAPRSAKADFPKNKFSSDWLGRYFLSLRSRWFRGFPTLRRKSCATMSEKFLNLISAESLLGLSKRTFSYLMYIVANDVPVLETLSEIPGSFNAFLRESYTARFSALQDRWWPTTRVWLLSPSAGVCFRTIQSSDGLYYYYKPEYLDLVADTYREMHTN